ncbi:hypothetical protein [Serratia liquefaciens]|uniref:hypothetical protein n=1 Tax=Serratia liquefaciens TaxID=614 RepID=UPI00218385F9|nr:hypothetical protein [Serratia liquefaciens]CAI2429944.1 Uncharacterised protein [Serratia liquefaciens]
MSKTLTGRCIQRWEVHFKPICDSKRSPYWRKRDLKGYIRHAAIITADCMVSEMAERNAKVDYGIDGWSPEFSSWFGSCRVRYEKEARDTLNEEASNIEIDENIECEIDCWND